MKISKNKYWINYCAVIVCLFITNSCGMKTKSEFHQESPKGPGQETLAGDPSGTYIAESDDNYIKILNVHTIKNYAKIPQRSVGFVHNELPTIDFHEGLKTILRSTDVGVVQNGEHFTTSLLEYKNEQSISYIRFDYEKGKRFRYYIETKSVDQKKNASTSGTLILADATMVLSMLTRQVQKYQKLYKSFALENYYVVLGSSEKNRNIFDNERCLSRFLNSCEKLQEIGFLPRTISNHSNPGPSANTPKEVIPTTPVIIEELPPNPSDKNRKRNNENPYILIKDKSNAQAIVNQATVECEDPNKCPSNVGLLIGSTGSSMYQCSTTYLGNRFFSTNSHCMPDNLINHNGGYFSNCTGSLWVKMPKIKNFDAIQLNCEKVVFMTQTNENNDPHESRDMMIFQVQENVNLVDRTTMAIDWNHAPATNSTLTFWPADPIPAKNGIHGMIRQKTCRASDPRGLDPILKERNKIYPITNLAACSPVIIPGNSGATASNMDHYNLGLVIISYTSLSTPGNGMSSNYGCSEIAYDSSSGTFVDRSDKLQCSEWITQKKSPIIGGIDKNPPPNFTDDVPRVTIDQPDAKNYRPYPYIANVNSADISKIVDQATVECQSSENCPDNVGLLIGSSDDEVFQCTATYIGNDLFITSSSCLPKHLINRVERNFSSKCNGSMWVKLPQTSSAPASTFSCKEIVSVLEGPVVEDTGESTQSMIFKVNEQVRNREAVKPRWSDNDNVPIGSSLGYWSAEARPEKLGIHGLIEQNLCTVDDPRAIDPIMKAFNRNYPITHLGCLREFSPGSIGATAYDSLQSVSINISSLAIINGNIRGDLNTRSIIATNYNCLQTMIDENGKTLDRSNEHCTSLFDDKSLTIAKKMLSLQKLIDDVEKQIPR